MKTRKANVVICYVSDSKSSDVTISITIRNDIIFFLFFHFWFLFLPMHVIYCISLSLSLSLSLSIHEMGWDFSWLYIATRKMTRWRRSRCVYRVSNNFI